MKSLQIVKSKLLAFGGGGAMDFATNSATNITADFATNFAMDFTRYSQIRDSQIRTNAFKITTFKIICATIFMAGFANAIELSSVCSGNTCSVTGRIPEVTNNGSFSGTISANGATIGSVFNYGSISGTISLDNSRISNFYNFGTISGTTTMTGSGFVTNLYNFGSISGVSSQMSNSGVKTITVDNRGTINAVRHADGTTSHFQSHHVVITNYSITINEDSTRFSNFSGNNGDTNSHIVYSNLLQGTTTPSEMTRISFKDGNSKLILDFGNNFEFGKEYPLNKLIVGVGGGVATAPNVDFSQLTTRSSLYTLTQGENGGFVIGLDTKNTEMGTLYKSNVRTMNNMFLISNEMIWQHKRQRGSQRAVRNIRPRGASSVFESPSYVDSSRGGEFGGIAMVDLGESWGESMSESYGKSRNFGESVGESLGESNAESLDLLALGESNGTFFYDSDSLRLAASVGQIRQYRNQNMGMRRNTATRTTTATTRANQNNTFYFMIAPYVNYNYYFQSGQHNLQGLEYGGVAAFSGKIAGINTLGLHFGFSYGKLSDKNDTNFDFTNMSFVANDSDKSFAIANMNFLAGAHYRLELIWDMYLKARGDFYYMMNQVKSFTIINALKPNVMGFGLSLAYGKDFDFGSGGVLGLELGVDYMGLNTSTVTLGNGGNANINETYNKSLYNLVYVDFGMSYDKYFGADGGGFGLNLGLGIRGDVTLNKLAKSQIVINNTRAVDMVLDSDKFLGYANVGIGYLLKARTFNMEFSLAYYGSFGDKGMSNGGGIEWRTSW